MTKRHLETIGDCTRKRSDRSTAIYALCEEDFTPRYVGKTDYYLHVRHKAPKAMKPRIQIAGNGTTYETAPDVPMPKLRLVEATGEPCRIIDPGFRGCKWPISGEGCETYFCCGPRELNKPYCEAHTTLGWNGKPTPNAATLAHRTGGRGRSFNRGSAVIG